MNYSKTNLSKISKFRFNCVINYKSFSFLFFLLIPCAFNLFAQSCGHAHHNTIKNSDALKFVPNHNQWDDQVVYQVEVGGMNTLFMETNALTWLFKDQAVAKQMHDNPDEANNMTMDAHAYKMRFIGSDQPTISGFKKQVAYHNYFLGSDQNKWAGRVPVYEGVVYDNLYEGVQMKAYSQYGNFKYDFIIKPGTEPSIIKMEYDGADEIFLAEEALHIKTSIEVIYEQKPYAYQIIDSVLVEVACEYKLHNNTVSFHLPNGYDPSVELVIDPVVIAATLSGSTSDNWGFSATYDNAGNIYAGGISFGPGYPTTMGAFQILHAGGDRDIAITKYVPDGSAQIYATYIGGSSNEAPHSMIVDFNGQLCIYGTTQSSNYPTTINAIQSNFEGQTDIVITKFNSEGTGLVGSTYMGGDANDGINNISPPSQSYDENRGEIVLDAQGNIYIASFSNSLNFPTTTNAFQTTNNGAQDGIVCKLNSDLSTLFWSTYIGVNGNDAAMGLRVSDNGRVIVLGTTSDDSFPVGNGGQQSTWPGGNSNAFVIKLSPDGQNIEQGTFFGTSDGTTYGYFIDTDEDNNVHIYGQTSGTVDVTPNTYFSNLGSKQYIVGFTPNLGEVVYSTVVGKGPGGTDFDFVPVAFMVDKCNGIYFSAFSAESGLPTTADAIDVGNDYFYLAKLSPNAETLDFATYYGNSFHVDGGTSRFDKAGIVYQAVCSCNTSVMTTLPNAYSNQGTSNCTIGVFKIDFEIETTTAAAFAEPSTSGCVPLTIDFQYTGSDGETFFWDFGTGVTSTEENPSYTFDEAGTYSVMQVVNAPNTCNVTDTFFLQIDVLDNNSTLTDTAFCPGNVNLFLDVTTANAIYNWQDGATGATYTVEEVGTYWVDVNIGNCVRRDSFTVSTASQINLELGADQIYCDVNSITLDATDINGANYAWSSGESDAIINVTSSGQYIVTVTDAFGCSTSDEVEIILGFTPDIQLGPDTSLCEGEPLVLTPTSSAGELEWQDGTNVNTYTVTAPGLYWVEADDQGCTDADSLLVTYNPTPIVDFNTEDVDCNGNSNGLIEPFFPQSVSDFDFLWSNGSTEIGLDELLAGNYAVSITDLNNCSFETTITVNEPDPINLIVEFKDVECYGDGNGMISLASTTGGAQPYSYSFNNGELTNNPVLSDLDGGTYTVLIQDANDCISTTEVVIYEPPQITLSAGEDKMIELGDSVRIDGFLFPDLGQDILWESDEYISCDTCLRPFGKPVNTADYILTYRDTTTGCTHIDTMNIFVTKPRNVFIPNVFSPDGDGVNDLFYPFGDQSIEKVNYMKIFDRWGEFVYEYNNFDMNDPTVGWDGMFKGKQMQPAVFVYVIEVLFKDDVVKVYKGDFTIVR